MSMRPLDEILKRLDTLPEDELKELERFVDRALGDGVSKTWCPTVGPQKDAMDSEADELFYGGSAGSGKTDLLVGLSLTRHRRSLVLRRTNKEASKLVERYVEILGSRQGWNGQDDVWHLPKGRVIDIGGCQHEDDRQKYKGTPRDGLFFDEIADFSESQYRFIITWNRSSNPTQRCRVVAAGNPPTTPEGLWVIQYWAPWLDQNHPAPARPGELRWFTTVNGKDAGVDGPGPHLVNGEMVRARSRTFIPGTLADNPYLSRTNYGATLAALPEELRAAYKEGRFDKSLRDHPKQVIKWEWIIAAQERWKANPRSPPGVPMCALGVDIAQGGSDMTTIACRFDAWYAPLICKPGAETPTPSSVTSLIIGNRRDNAAIVCDVGGGYGGGTIERLRENGIAATAFNGAHKAIGRTGDKALSFSNKRALSWWRFREALDPDQRDGSPICLPDDPALRADLAAPHWELTPRGIRIEEKDDIKKRIGRSPDRGDAVVMAWADGQMALARGLGPASRGGSQHSRPKYAIVGYSSQKERRRRLRG